jgi:hypothetical protein
VEQPQDADWQHSFGVVPERDSDLDDAWVLAGSLVPGAGEHLRVSWDLHGDSVRFRWTQAGVLRLDLYREAVSRLTIPDERGPQSSLRVDYKQEGVTGVVQVQVWPHFTCTDTLLHVR